MEADCIYLHSAVKKHQNRVLKNLKNGGRLYLLTFRWLKFGIHNKQTDQKKGPTIFGIHNKHTIFICAKYQSNSRGLSI